LALGFLEINDKIELFQCSNNNPMRQLEKYYKIRKEDVNSSDHSNL